MWIKGRTKLNRLRKEMDDADVFPKPGDSWDSYTNSIGTYFISRKLEQSEIGGFDVRLDEFITYYVGLVKKAGGVKKFLPSHPNRKA